MISFEEHITITINAAIKSANFYLNNPSVPEHMHHYISGQLDTLDYLLLISGGMKDEHERLNAFMKTWKQLEYA